MAQELAVIGLWHLECEEKNDSILTFFEGFSDDSSNELFSRSNSFPTIAQPPLSYQQVQCKQVMDS